MKTSLFRKLIRNRSLPRLVRPSEGYDTWASTYDSQPDNAVLAFDARLFSELIATVEIENKVVVDVGCGTGRHWKEILSRQPARLTGIDPSIGMLRQLKARFADANTICAEGDDLSAIPDESCDVIISTLALAHISNSALAFREWTRVLRKGGVIILTDFHPDAIRAGMKRTCTTSKGTIEIEQHLIDLGLLRSMTADCGLALTCLRELAIDKSVRSLFVGAAERYEQYEGLRLVFGACLVKS